MLTTKAENIPCNIVIDRIKQYITLTDACNYIGMSVQYISQLKNIKSSSDFKPESNRDITYHLQKIKFFMENGIDKPIDIDSLCKGKQIYNWPIIIDGRHRYIAAILRRDKLIKATFTGSQELMDYLTFKSNRKPNTNIL